MINSNLSPISHHFRDTAILIILKTSIKNCGQTAADGDIIHGYY